MQPKWGQVRLTEVNPYLVCVLCRGYFIDATTIVECLHSFCRSCIIKYLENNTFCPICDVQIHKAKPFRNIKPDKTLQNIVYKLVPSLYHKEMVRRRAFYAKHPKYAARTTPEDRGEGLERMIYAPAESISLSLEYYDVEREREEWESISVSSHNSDIVETFWIKKRYLLCPALVTVGVLKKFLRNKYDLTPRHRVEILHKRESLSDDLKLMDVAYIYTWKQKGPIQFQYRFCNVTTTTEAASNLQNEKDWTRETQCELGPSPAIPTLSPVPSPVVPSPSTICNSLASLTAISSPLLSPAAICSPDPNPATVPIPTSSSPDNSNDISGSVHDRADLAVSSIPAASPVPTPIPAASPSPVPTIAPSPIPALVSSSPSPVTTLVSSSPSHDPIIVASPSPASVPAASPSPAPIRTASPSPAPIRAATPSSVPTPAASPTLAPSPVSNPATIRSTTSSPAPIPTTSPRLTPIPAASPRPALIPAASPKPAPIPATSPRPAPIPAVIRNHADIPSPANVTISNSDASLDTVRVPNTKTVLSPAASPLPNSVLHSESVIPQPPTSVGTATSSTSLDVNFTMEVSSSMQSPLSPTHGKRVKQTGVKKSKGEPNLLESSGSSSSSISGSDNTSTPGKTLKPIVPSKRTASQVAQGVASRISIGLLASLALERRQQSVPIISATRKNTSLELKLEEKRPRLVSKLAPPLPALTSITSSSVSKSMPNRDLMSTASTSTANKSSADSTSTMSRLILNKSSSATTSTSSKLLGNKSSAATSTSSKLVVNKGSIATSISSKLIANKSSMDTEFHVAKSPSQNVSAVNSITKKSCGPCVPDTLTITPIVIPKKDHKGTEQKTCVEVPVKVSLTVEEVTREGAFTTEPNAGRLQRQVSSIPRLVELSKSVAKKPRLTVRRVNKRPSSQKLECISALDLSSSSQHPRPQPTDILNIAQTLARRQQQRLATSSLTRSPAPPIAPSPAPPLSPLSSMSAFPVNSIMPVRSPPPSLRIPVPPTSSANFRVQGPSQQRPAPLLPASSSPAEGRSSMLRNPRLPGACTPPHNLFQTQAHLLPPPPPPRSFMFRSRYEMQNPWHGEWYNEQLLQCLGRLRHGDSMPPTPYFPTKTGTSNSRK